MNNLTPHQPQPAGAIAVVHAFLARLLAMLRSVGYRNELQRQLRGPIGAHLVHDPVVMGTTRAQRPMQQVSCARRRFVATRHERLAGAPP